MSLKPQTIMVIENNIAIKWEDQSESYLSNKELRDKCPCANCSGESDVFGNVYKFIRCICLRPNAIFQFYIGFDWTPMKTGFRASRRR